MTNQVIFDKVSAHLLAQNAKSMAFIDKFQGQACAYRGAEGRTCAAGCLIPEERYASRMEGKTVYQIDFFNIEFKFDQLHLIRGLQEIHDDLSVADWRAGLQQLANRFNLTLNF